MTGHLGELAALYALGALEPHEQRGVEKHLEVCDACRRLLAQAEADVTAMVSAQARLDPPSPLRAPRAAQPVRAPLRLAFAAAIVIALLPAGYLLEQNLAMHQAMIADAQGVARVAMLPHRTASFTGADARVMYAPDGSWYMVVIRGAKRPLALLWPHDGTQTMLGFAMPHGDVALLYLPKSHRMNQLSLMLDGRVVGQAQLAF
ncbi:MAG TPA: zf-HC2 domain-containing protein [Candidatus Baltobacteraceae bacterium]|nr:zf-HC2 domain-containing protein [Candidatus Baltobacteraceae bacterium]